MKSNQSIPNTFKNMNGSRGKKTTTQKKRVMTSASTSNLMNCINGVNGLKLKNNGHSSTRKQKTFHGVHDNFNIATPKNSCGMTLEMPNTFTMRKPSVENSRNNQTYRQSSSREYHNGGSITNRTVQNTNFVDFLPQNVRKNPQYKLENTMGQNHPRKENY
mmetsp:Transcript_9196/g.8129  ORF Transcript_9196/g.8129 Transcript_9196/m.8129 type:complete len:161 (+) Transcript_9196:451-933(+)